jgi:radical SAM protein with 4Fe4S-binding SPASM domain
MYDDPGCYIPDFAAPDLLPTARILDLLEELAEAGTLFLTLSGGEVLTRRDWAVVARRARELGFFVVVLTNGYLVDEATADALAGLPAKVEVSVSDFRAFPVIVARRDGDPAPLALRPKGEELREFLAGPHFDCGEVRAAGDVDPAGTPCAAGFRFCTITPGGDVIACSILPGSAGNLRERSFREVWDDSPWFARLRALRRGDLPACRGCSYGPPATAARPRRWSRPATSSGRFRRRASGPR